MNKRVTKICFHSIVSKWYFGMIGNSYFSVPNPCAMNPCLHNGACIDASNSKDKGILMADRNDYKCFCTPGYRGKNCEGVYVEDVL